MSRHYHAASAADSDQTFALRRHAAAAAQGPVRPCDDGSHFVEVGACPICHGAVAFRRAGQDLALYACDRGCTVRIQQAY